MFDKLELRKQPGIYIFNNKVNGKKYVGESLDIYKRFIAYKYPKPRRPFEHALLKYGCDGFDLQIMYFPGITKDELLDLEETFICLETSLVTEHGYNVCVKGLDNTGRKGSEEFKKRQSISMYGRNLVGSKNPYSKAVNQYSTYGALIKSYNCLSDAARELGIHCGNISECCRKKRKSAGGFIWSYCL